jgi:ribosomal protein S18 acetylase RimI-like enzyme
MRERRAEFHPIHHSLERNDKLFRQTKMNSQSDLRVSVILKPATRADETILVRMIERYYAFDNIAFSEESARLGLRALFKDQSAGQAFLVALDSEFIGYTILTDSFDLEFGGRVGLITDLYLDAEYRRQGIGTKVMRLLEEICRKKGIGTLELQVEHGNEAARSFYQRMGFRAHDRVPMSKCLAC